jgi:hypothetical protein
VSFGTGLLTGVAWLGIGLLVRLIGGAVAFTAASVLSTRRRRRIVVTVCDGVNLASVALAAATTLAIPVTILLSLAQWWRDEGMTSFWAGVLVSSLASIPLGAFFLLLLAFSMDRAPSETVSEESAPPSTPDDRDLERGRDSVLGDSSPHRSDRLAFTARSDDGLVRCAVVLDPASLVELEASAQAAIAEVHPRDDMGRAVYLLRPLADSDADCIAVVSTRTSPDAAFGTLVEATRAAGAHLAKDGPAQAHLVQECARALAWSLAYDLRLEPARQMTPTEVRERLTMIRLP